MTSAVAQSCPNAAGLFRHEQTTSSATTSSVLRVGVFAKGRLIGFVFHDVQSRRASCVAAYRAALHEIIL